jgi:hypothetical protein
MNIQDLEDFEQDFFLATYAGNFSDAQLSSKRELFLNSRKAGIAAKARVRARYNDLKHGVDFRPTEDELVFNVLIKANNLPNKQLAVIKAFLKHGSLKQIAIETNENENTVKANFRHATTTLRKLMEANNE